MGFTPITFDKYVELHMKANPGEDRNRFVRQLHQTLAAFKAGARCFHCGAPIWVIGSSQTGLACFTCITGEADPSEDYELQEACEPT